MIEWALSRVYAGAKRRGLVSGMVHKCPSHGPAWHLSCKIFGGTLGHHSQGCQWWSFPNPREQAAQSLKMVQFQKPSNN